MFGAWREIAPVLRVRLRRWTRLLRNIRVRPARMRFNFKGVQSRGWHRGVWDRRHAAYGAGCAVAASAAVCWRKVLLENANVILQDEYKSSFLLLDSISDMQIDRWRTSY